MPESYHKVRVQLPSGKTFDVECYRADETDAARAATWIQYEHNLTHSRKDPSTIDVSRIPDGWAQMSDDQKYALAIEAGYRAVAVAFYVDRKLTWQAL